MPRRTPWLLFLALALASPAVARPADPLWSRAVEAASRAKEWSPGEMRLAIQVADDEGKVLETWDNRYRLSTGADGTVRTEVVSAFHNRKDETQKEREAQAKRELNARSGGAPTMSGFGDDPFEPSVQDAVEIRRLAGTRDIAGASCVAFSYILAKPKGASVEGTAWLEAATGFPVEVVSSPEPLPRGVHEMSTTVRYAGGLVSEVLVEGSGSLLFFKRRFSSVITLGGWVRKPLVR